MFCVPQRKEIYTYWRMDGSHCALPLKEMRQWCFHWWGSEWNNLENRMWSINPLPPTREAKYKRPIIHISHFFCFSLHVKSGGSKMVTIPEQVLPRCFAFWMQLVFFAGMHMNWAAILLDKSFNLTLLETTCTSKSEKRKKKNKQKQNYKWT